MSNSSQSKHESSPSVLKCTVDYRQQQKNLQVNEDYWRQVLRQGGVKAVLEKKKEIENQWKKQPVLIAVIGQTGSGKSTLIRRLLGYQPEDPDGPSVGSGVEECTKYSEEYHKPGTGLVYTDLPGVGSTTTAFAFTTPTEQHTYVNRFSLARIDYFLLVSQNKFNDQEKLLTEYVKQKLQKKFIFVQTKMDTLRSEHGNQKIEDTEGFIAVKNKVRVQINDKLGSNNAQRIFLISNHAIKGHRNGQKCYVYDTSPDYEFDSLWEQIQDDMLREGGLTAEKGKAFILATGAISKSAIRAKAKVLRTQSWVWSTLSGMLGAVPLPGISLACDFTIIIRNAVDYFEAFGLKSSDYLGEGSIAVQVKNLICVMSASMGLRVAGILAVAIGSSVIDEDVKAVPVVGTVIGMALGVGTSFASTCTILHYLIDFCEIKALEMMQ